MKRWCVQWWSLHPVDGLTFLSSIKFSVWSFSAMTSAICGVFKNECACGNIRRMARVRFGKHGALHCLAASGRKNSCATSKWIWIEERGKPGVVKCIRMADGGIKDLYLFEFYSKFGIVSFANMDIPVFIVFLHGQSISCIVYSMICLSPRSSFIMISVCSSSPNLKMWLSNSIKPFFL